VIGAGTMGHGIAQVSAVAGLETTIVDVEEEVLENAVEKIEGSLGQMGVEDTDAVLDRIETTTDRRAGLADADVMIEAVPENLDLKEEVFSDADDVMPEEAVLATNTSTLPITEIAEATDRPESVVGMHFSNPVQLMPIVEVIRGEETSDRIFEFAERFAERLEKTPVLVEKDVPGFVLNRINYAFWSEALRRVDEGEQEPKAIDASVRRLGFPMGPFEILDFSGLDMFLLAAREMRDHGVSVNVPDVLEELVDAGKHGMKTGEGFYEYPEPGEYSRVSIPRERRFEFNPLYMMASATNEAAWLIDNDVTTREDIDTAMQIGMNWPRGLLEFADEYGIDRIVETLEELHERTGWDQYEPHPMLERMVEDGRLGLKAGEGFYDHEFESETFDTITYERRDFAAIITLNRPSKLNAMDETSWLGLRAALEHAAEDDDVRATIIRGAGNTFSAGDDIAEMQGWETADEGSTYFDEVALPTIETLRAHPKPTIALVDGIATGAGCEMVLLCDLGVAADGSRFGQPEATIGAIPPAWLTYGITTASKKEIMELAMTGDLLSASEAADIGLVNYAVDDGQAEDVARELARSTTAAAPQSIETIKDTWVGMENELFDAWLAYAVSELTALIQTEEGRHGLAAFLEDDTPRWER
jgi:enoyl-CoA hydratase/3-hydroxyacyl-CoA dehydrogenase